MVKARNAKPTTQRGHKGRPYGRGYCGNKRNYLVRMAYGAYRTTSVSGRKAAQANQKWLA